MPKSILPLTDAKISAATPKDNPYKLGDGDGLYLPFRIDVLRSQALANLSPYAAKLLLDIASQWQLGCNGDASAAFENVLRARGWRSKATLHNALKELRQSGLIVQTRQGSLHQCSLYALER